MHTILSLFLVATLQLGIPEMIIFLLAAILLGFSIHFFWAGKRSVPGIPEELQGTAEGISGDDKWRLDFYEQIEKHEQNVERLEKELLRATESERALLAELEETRDEVSRLERLLEKASTEKEAPSRNLTDLVVAQQALTESFTKEMTERLDRAYKEFNILQDSIQKIQSQLGDPRRSSPAYEELEQSYFRITKEYDELKMRHFELMEENHRLTRTLADTEEKLRDASFQRQQLTRKVQFLEELNGDLQQLSGHQKKLEAQLRRIGEIESILTRTAGGAS